MSSLLFTPGPTPTPEFLRLSLAKHSMHHRSEEFEAIFREVRESLSLMVGLEETLILASSGTGAMEACVLSLSSKPLVINSGKFGERFSLIAKAHNKSFIEIKSTWNEGPKLEEIQEQLHKNKDIDAICLQVCESSSGLRLPFEDIASLAKKINGNIKVILDGITGVGVEKLDTSNIDALIGGSQKAFMLPPGMSFISLSALAIDEIERRSVGYYFNLAEELQNQRKNTTAFSSPTALIIALNDFFKSVSLEKLYVDTKNRALAFREVYRLLHLYAYPNKEALALSAIYHERAEDIRKTLKNTFNINVAGGQDNLKNKIFRINHMGLIPEYENLFLVNALELTLDLLGIRKFNGVGNITYINSLRQAGAFK